MRDQQNQQNQQNQNTGNQNFQGQGGGKIDNALYDVVTVLHEKSKGLEAYDKYEKDLAQHNQLREIFNEIRRNDEQAVRRLEQALRTLLGSGGQQSYRSQSEEDIAA